MLSEFQRILISRGFTEDNAFRCAEIFTNNSIDGVYSHSVNRFASFIKMVDKGYVKPNNVPSLKSKHAGIEHQVIFNKGAVMVLPPGINKAKGLLEALNQMKYSVHNVVCAGDAENDNAMMQVTECSVAVANALDAVKQTASIVTSKDHGAGVTELINRLLANDLADIDDQQQRYRLHIGKIKEDVPFTMSAYRGGILLAGTSGGGKSTFTTAFLESLIEMGYQFCLVDPEGDYLAFPNTIVIGDAEHEPVMEEILTLLENPSQHVVICILAIPLDKRPSFFNNLLTQIAALRIHTGHPHWFIFDEASHLLPAETESSFFNIPAGLNNFLLITTKPSLVNKAIMQYVTMLITVGDNPTKTLEEFAVLKKISLSTAVYPLAKGEAWIWDIEKNWQPFSIICRQPEHLSKRHIRKYTAGTMDYNNFYFRGPQGKLNLKAYNVIIFMQLAEGVDDETWMFHLKQHDYSKWFKEAVHNEELADLIRDIETRETDAEISKNKIIKLIAKRYTAAGE